MTTPCKLNGCDSFRKQCSCHANKEILNHFHQIQVTEKNQTGGNVGECGKLKSIHGGAVAITQH